MSRSMRRAGRVAFMEQRRCLYRVLVGKSQGKRPLGRPRPSMEDNIKMELKEIEWEGRGI